MFGHEGFTPYTNDRVHTPHHVSICTHIYRYVNKESKMPSVCMQSPGMRVWGGWNNHHSIRLGRGHVRVTASFVTSPSTIFGFASAVTAQASMLASSSALLPGPCTSNCSHKSRNEFPSPLHRRSSHNTWYFSSQM